jgi:hypothetical protein
MAVKYTNIFHSKALKNMYTRTGIFGLKINHLATLLQEERRRQEMDRYEHLLEQRIRYGSDSDMRYVFHPYFGYIPTQDVNEDLAEEINPDQLFRFHPKHGFVPAADDRSGPDFFYDDYGVSDDGGEDFYPRRENPFRGPGKPDKPIAVKGSIL